MKPLPPISAKEMMLEQAAQQAVDKLPYRKFNPAAKKVAAQAKAHHLQARR